MDSKERREWIARMREDVKKQCLRIADRRDSTAGALLLIADILLTDLEARCEESSEVR